MRGDCVLNARLKRQCRHGLLVPQASTLHTGCLHSVGFLYCCSSSFGMLSFRSGPTQTFEVRGKYMCLWQCFAALRV